MSFNSQLSFGTLSGVNITALNATQLTSGVVPIGRIGATGIASASTYLRGDNAWVAVSGGSGGSASDSFSTITVAGQSNVVADSATDTLTLVAGSNITITTNAGTDTITIAAAGNAVGPTSLNSLTDVAITTPIAGQVLKYNGLTWINDVDATTGSAGAGTVTSVSVVSANGFTGTVATASSTPAITITTSITGVLKGNGTAISAAVSGADYQAPITFTTTGSSGIATFISNTLNIPQYAGDAVGPATATDNAITRFNATTGKLLKNSLVTISDTGLITAPSVGNIIPFYYDNISGFPSSSTYHGAVAHAHNTGKLYYAHSGWNQLANASDAVSANTASTTVARDASGNFSAGTITATALTATGVITGAQVGNVIPFYFANQAAFSSASTYHGAIAHSHADGKMYFAHNGVWSALANASEIQPAQNVTGIVKSSGTTLSAAVAGTDYQAPITFTTTGSSGAATFNGTVLNIPQYATGSTAFTGLSDASSAGLTVDEIYLPAITKLTVTASGSSAYLFDQYSSNNPTIYAISGTTIAFDLGAGALSNHPFFIRTSSGTNYNTGLTHVTSAGVVTTGSSAQGKTSGTLYWKIPASISGAYQYICDNHNNMAGVITITPPIITRTTANGATAILVNAATGNLTITGYKGYSLYKIQTSAASWVRIYTDTVSRSADAGRNELTDPNPGSGVIAEVITTGAETILISPGAMGFSNESIPSTNIELAVTNKSGSTAAITVTLTVLQLEA